MAKMTVEDTSLTAVADAIREKGGTTDPLIFPDGFVNAVGNIQTGGTDELFKIYVEGELNELNAEILAGCTKISNYAFAYNGFLSVDIPENIKSIGLKAFLNSFRIKSLVIPASVDSLDRDAFSSCQLLESVVLERAIPLSQGLFSRCPSLKNISLPEGITQLPIDLFYNCTSLKSFTIPESVVSLGNYVFQTCRALTDIIIPRNVTSMGTKLFETCVSLETVEMKPTVPPSAGPLMFNGCTALTRIIVPVGTLSAYQSATNWAAYADLMVEASE